MGKRKWLQKVADKERLEKNMLAEVVVKLVRHMVAKKGKGLAEVVEDNGGKEVLAET